MKCAFEKNLLMLIVVCLLLTAVSNAQKLEKGFIAPPDDSKPWVYWYWLEGDISKEGITKDLEAMKRVGVGEALIGHINLRNESEGIQLLSEEWWQHVDHAVREGKRIGVDIGMFNGPGWSQSGGTWISPEDSMQYVVSGEVRVEGPMRFSGKLPMSNKFITDIAVLAYPASDGEEFLIENHHPIITFKSKQKLSHIVNVGNGSINTVNTTGINMPDISKAKWIWYPEGNPVEAVAAGDRYYRQIFIIPDNSSIVNANLAITADNAQWVWINGKSVDKAASDNWREITVCDIARYLKTGENVIAVKVNNEGSNPSPAGLIASAKIQIADREDININTDSDWMASALSADRWYEVHVPKEQWTMVRYLGSYGDQPWGNILADGDSSCSIEWQLQEEFVARSLVFKFVPPAGLDISGRLEALNSDGAFSTVKEFSYTRSVRNDPGDSTMFLQKAPVIFTFVPTASKHYRLKLDKTGGVTEFKLSSASMVENAAEKQMGRLWPTPLPEWDSYMWAQPENAEDTSGAIHPATVKNISAMMDDNGVLTWQVPEGKWIIKHFGSVSTEVENRPAAPEVRGLECDKMSKAAIAKHFDTMVGKSLSRVSKKDRQAVKHVVIDSYEVGGQNWTQGFEKIFEERFGYGLLSYLPVLDGNVVGSPDISERFLWDLRRLVADLIAENYVGGLKEVANKQGLDLWLENYGHWGYPGEFLQYGGYADQVSGEFWTDNELGSIELRDAASCVHTYGKKIVSAEAFTSSLNTRDTPFAIKRRGDWAFTEGINHFVLHVYAHQSEDMPAPGRNPWFGTAFHRNNPWFMNAGTWFDYLHRCHYMLQQGHHVADVAYFIGEDAPKMRGVRKQTLPDGYNFDYINADVIRDRMTIKNGRWTLPDGMSYSVLALPNLETMRPELLTKIRNLVKQGGIVIGTPPRRSPSLQGYPVCDDKITKLANEIWANCDGIKVKQRKFGKGMVFNGVDLHTVFDTLKISPEITIAESGLLWTHRADKENDIYFISNQNSHSVLANMTFRVDGRAPEIWDPATGEIVHTARFQCKDDRTSVSVPMDNSGSVFVVFGKKVRSKSVESVMVDGRVLDCSEVQVFFDTKSNLKVKVTEAGEYIVTFNDGNEVGFNVQSMPADITIGGSWDVIFSLASGLVNKRFDRLMPWALYDDDIKNFSGTATYSKTINIPAGFFAKDRRIMLDTGSADAMVQVRVNDKEFETQWKPPFELDITSYVKPGENLIEISVTNSHGSGQSGLTGPVKLSSVAVVELSSSRWQ